LLFLILLHLPSVACFVYALFFSLFYLRNKEKKVFNCTVQKYYLTVQLQQKRNVVRLRSLVEALEPV
jgi:hypothetical protein